MVVGTRDSGRIRFTPPVRWRLIIVFIFEGERCRGSIFRQKSSPRHTVVKSRLFTPREKKESLGWVSCLLSGSGEPEYMCLVSDRCPSTPVLRGDSYVPWTKGYGFEFLTPKVRFPPFGFFKPPRRCCRRIGSRWFLLQVNFTLRSYKEGGLDLESVYL